MKTTKIEWADRWKALVELQTELKAAKQIELEKWQARAKNET